MTCFFRACGLKLWCLSCTYVVFEILRCCWKRLLFFFSHFWRCVLALCNIFYRSLVCFLLSYLEHRAKNSHELISLSMNSAFLWGRSFLIDQCLVKALVISSWSVMKEFDSGSLIQWIAVALFRPQYCRILFQIFFTFCVWADAGCKFVDTVYTRYP